MKKFLLIIIVFCSIQSVFAQRHELGVSVGGANVIGDVGKGNYINPFPTRLSKNGSIYLPGSIGALYRFNFNPHMGFRASLSYSRAGASDHLSGEQFKIDRNKSFSNTILEGAVLFEYNFKDINEAQEFAHSPYIFFGAGLANYRTRSYDLDNTNRIVSTDKRDNSLVLPFGVGYKVRLNYNMVVSLETGFRYTGKDDLDYNNPKFSTKMQQAGVTDTTIDQFMQSKTFGNLSNNDWYVITGLTLTYSFGRPACYCN